MNARDIVIQDKDFHFPSGIQGNNLFSGGGQKPVMAEFWDEHSRRSDYGFSSRAYSTAA